MGIGCWPASRWPIRHRREHAACWDVTASMVHMAGQRVGRPVRGAQAVLEADAGCFERWGLRVGDDLEVRS